MSRRRSQVTIPIPYENLASLRSVAMATKELAETLAGQRGDPRDVAVTWDDLIRLGIITEQDLPRDIGSGRRATG